MCAAQIPFKAFKLLSCVCVCFSASVRLCLSMRTESWAICSSSVVGNISIKKLRVPNRLPISNTQTHTHAHTNTPYWPHPGEAVLPELMHYVTRLSWELLNGHTDSKIEKKSRVGQEEDTKWNRVCTQQGESTWKLWIFWGMSLKLGKTKAQHQNQVPKCCFSYVSDIVTFWTSKSLLL